MKTFLRSCLVCFLASFLVQSSSHVEIIFLNHKNLGKTLDKAQWVGGGDEEFKRREAVHLTGSFILQVENGNLIGSLYADFKEVQLHPGNRSDGTEFVLREKYPIYQPNVGYKIVDFKISYDTKTASNFDFMGRQDPTLDWSQNDAPNGGPISAITWVGDQSSDQDQILGCYIIPYLKPLIIIIEKIK